MGQYKTGTVNINHNSAIVTGNGTTWITDSITSGWMFTINGEKNIYWIDSVDSETQITLVQNYLNAKSENLFRATYAIIQDYTTNYEWPQIKTGDMNWTEILRLSMHKIDQQMYVRSSRNINFGVTPSGTLYPLIGEAASAYIAHSSIIPTKGKIFYDDYYKTFLYYTGSALSAEVVTGVTSGVLWYPELREMANTNV